MEKFTTIEAAACPLPAENIDTDQLIPARFMQRPRGDGYAEYLLYDLRVDAAGTRNADYPLNQPGYAAAQVLVTRRNFGCGSSREAAVYALLDYGIRCVLAPSFGDIFAANAVNNGLLPGRITDAEAEMLLAALQTAPSIYVDLLTCRYKAGAAEGGFAIDPLRRKKLLNGWEDVDLTLEHAAAIRQFVAADALKRSWAVPSLRGGGSGHLQASAAALAE